MWTVGRVERSTTCPSSVCRSIILVSQVSSASAARHSSRRRSSIPRTSSGGSLEPPIVHVVQQLLVRSHRVEAENGVDAAVGAERRLLIVYPLNDSVRRELVKTIEAAADP